FLGSRLQGDFPRFEGFRTAQMLDGDNDVFDFGPMEEFTIELKVKKNRGPNNNYRFYYPSILGKRPEWSSNWPSVGWVIFLEDSFWQFNMRGSNNNAGQVQGGTLSDATWNTLSVSCIVRN